MGPSPRRRNKSKPRIQVIATNRFGLSFARNCARTTYAGSGRRFAAYYRLACVRCGWRFAGSRWQGHRLIDCDAIRAQRGQPLFVGLRQQSLYGAP